VDKVRLQRNLGYSFKEPKYLQLALTHRSLGNNNNERLEFLGDAILGFVVAEQIFTEFPNQKEGQLSRIRSRLVKRETLAEIATELDLGDYLALGHGELRSGGQTRSSILADAVEAIIAAIYLDSGMDAARIFIHNVLKTRIDKIQPDQQTKDPKTMLQEYLQARKIALPEYKVLSVTGEQHEQDFSVSCRVAGLDRLSTGQGPSRRAAEQHAAEQLLATLGSH